MVDACAARRWHCVGVGKGNRNLVLDGVKHRLDSYGRKVLALVTDDLRVSMRTVVSDYLKRWAIELLIKDKKQQLGLADYRVLRYQAVIRDLHLVDAAYAYLTHLALTEPRAQGQRKNKNVLRLPPISQLKTRMRQIVWREAVKDVPKHSHERPVLRRLEKHFAA